MNISNDTPLFIQDCSVITPTGNTLTATYAAIACGLSAFSETAYLNSASIPIKGCRVPEGALCLIAEIPEGLGERASRMLRLGLSALEPLRSTLGSLTLPLFLACPETHPSQQDASQMIGGAFFRDLYKLSNLKLDTANCRYISAGRTGGVELLALAREYFSKEGAGDTVVVGAIDSFFDADLLSLLDADGRLMANGKKTGFFPGEAAVFLIITSNAEQAKYRTHIKQTGLALEEGHYYDKEPNLANGMTSICHQMLAKNTPLQFSHLWSTANGEPYFTRELGIIINRYSTYLSDSFIHHHPADCIGDCGAASGLALVALSAESAESNQHSYSSLVLTASDSQHRAGVILET